MVTFKKKSIITASSLGEDLHKARKVLNLTLSSVESKIGIAKKYLISLENNDWENIPGEVYAKNWLKKYSKLLGLQWDDIRKKFEDELSRQKLWTDGKKHKFGVSKKRFIILPRIIKNALIILTVVAIVLYLALQLWSLLSPPSLKIVYPESDFITNSSYIKIVGQVTNESWFGLNDKEVATDSDGWFTVDMDLNKGLNVIKLEAKKRYGRSTIKYCRVIVEE
jgi:transcriptional regulator with XRE-family HTH domain